MNESLENLYLEHRQGLYSLAVAVTGSHSLAEDAVHNAFVKLFRRELPDGDHVAYVFRTVRNSAIDVSRNASRQNRLKDMLVNGFHPSQIKMQTPPEQLLTEERHERLRVAIQELPLAEQEAVILKAFADLTFEQAGLVTNLSSKTIATRYRRALIKLERQLSHEFETE